MVKHNYRNFLSHSIPFFSDQIEIPFVVVLLLISAIISDMMISTFYSSLRTQLASTLGIALFIGIVIAVYGIGQYFLLRFINHVSNSIRSKERQFDIMYKGMARIQYVLSFVFLFLILQMLSTHQYYTSLIVSIIAISFVPSVIIAGFLSYKFFLWYKLAENKRKNVVILLYALAFSLVAIGAMVRVIFYNGMLLAKPAIVSSSSSHIVVSGMTFSASPATAHLTEAMRAELSRIFYSADIPLILSFMFLWIATAMLLNHYSQKFGRIRYWTMICLPLIPFLAGMFPTLLGQMPDNAGFLDYKRSLLLYIVIFKIAVVVGAVLFSTAFFVMAENIRRKLDQNNTTVIGADVKNYLLLCSYGIVILAVSLSSSEIHTPYPPFGVVAFSFAALGVYMFTLGIYSTANSIANDAKLRHSIRKYVIEQSRLLDSIGNIQMQQEIEERVLKLSKAQQESLQEQTGVAASLNEQDTKKYLDEVLDELKKPHKQKNDT
jgi:hypothetical protein